MAKKGDTVYLPQDMNVQLARSDEYPAGRVVQLKQGYVELTDELAGHPILSRLQADLPVESERRKKLFDAQQKRDEIVNKADAELAEAKAAIAVEYQESTAKAAEEWQGRKDEAATSGASFNEPHPDLDTRRAIAVTAPAAVHATMTADTFTNSAVLADERKSVREEAATETSTDDKSPSRRARTAD